MDVAHFFESLTLRKALSISLIAHVAGIMFALVHPHLFQSSRPFRATVYRVNLVSLPPPPAAPALAGQGAAAPAAAPAAKPASSGPRVIEKTSTTASKKTRKEPEKKSTAKPKPPPPKPQDRSSELSQAIASIKKDLVSKIESESRSDLGPFILGSAETGRADPVFERYLEEISEKIKTSWVYPASQPSAQAIITIKIAKDGKIIDAQVEESSGDSAYDASALRAVQKANPLPPLPSLRYGNPLELGLRF